MSFPTDILFEVAVRSSISTLEKLYLTSLSEQIASLLSNNVFWYQRTEWHIGRELASRPNANWNGIYHSIKEAMETDLSPLLCIMDNLDTLLVYIEVTGLLRESNRDLWLHAAYPEVLHHLLRVGTMKYDAEFAADALLYQSELDDSGAMVQALLDQLGRDADQKLLDACLLRASSRRGVSGLSVLLSATDYFRRVLKKTFDIAIDKNSPEAVELLLTVYDISYDERLRVVENRKIRSPRMLMALYATRGRFFRGHARDAILKAVTAFDVELSEYEEVIDDARVDLMSCVTYLAEYTMIETHRNALLSSPRLRTEHLAAQQVELLYRENAKTRAYLMATGRDGLLDVIMDAVTPYDQILRYVVLKERRAREDLPPELLSEFDDEQRRVLMAMLDAEQQ